MNILAVIFDMDGVLVDSEEVITKASILALQEWGINPCKNDFKQFTGMGENKFIGGVANKYGLEFSLDMKKRAYEIYIDIVDDEIKLYNGVKQLIEYLRNKNLKIALASSADLIKVKANLKAASIPLTYFDTLLCGDMVKNKKPAPDIFLKASYNLKISSEHCIVIEDALSGIIAAKAAKMKCIAVTTSFSNKQFIPLKPDYIINNTIELKKIL